MPRINRLWAGLLGAVLATGANGGSASGATPPSRLDADAVRSFLADTIPPAMSKASIEGVAVIVVQSGHVVAAEGFGKSHGGSPEVIHAAASVFRAGSLSKPITAALVLQLVEEGKVDLDRDVSGYVGFEVPSRNGRAVTLRDILTQSSGFSDTYRLLFATDPADLHSLGDYARNRLPPLLFVPGTQPAYSNYAFGLAGYLVERLRGKPFAAVARERIFTPLKMSSATFSQPPEPAIAARLVTGYRRGGSRSGPFEYVSPESAGGLSISAADYARFAGALIEGGALDGGRILRSDTAASMLTLNAGPEGASRTEVGMGLGVTVDRTRPGMTAIGHSGDTVQYHSIFRAYPEQDLVIVAMQNTEGPPLIRTIVRTFEERFGLTPPVLPSAPDAAEDQEVAGVYATGRYSSHSFLRIGHLFQLLTIQTVPGGGIRLGGAPEPLRRVGPSLYQDPTRTERRALFLRADHGRVTGVRVEPYQTMLRVPPWERPSLVISLIGAGTVIAILTVLGLAWNMVRARAAPPLAWRLAGLASLALVACVCGFYTTVTTMRDDFYSMTPAFDPWIRAFEGAGIVGAIALIGFALAMPGRWRMARLPERMGAIAFVAGLGVTLLVLADYRVLTSTLNY
ncbi:MAG TPA: serine hydrolase domain-containing protein [Steroidobacteraceae bacterium]|jgi:CubicO group peptidase (beta-lactamase class C family)|nr:serine hydrolase domain-containing protein [Steroidobacteraceae bacterium]